MNLHELDRIVTNIRAGSNPCPPSEEKDNATTIGQSFFGWNILFMEVGSGPKTGSGAVGGESRYKLRRKVNVDTPRR